MQAAQTAGKLIPGSEPAVGALAATLASLCAAAAGADDR
jgi:hypothetical protein